VVGPSGGNRQPWNLSEPKWNPHAPRRATGIP
jgi:hypothetical protein